MVISSDPVVISQAAGARTATGPHWPSLVYSLGSHKGSVGMMSAASTR